MAEGGSTPHTEAVIILAATPIGNLGDASKRLIEALSNAEVIAREDTRTTIHLMRALGIENRPRLIALHAEGKLPLERLEKRYSLDEIGRAADDMHRGVTVKPVIVF